MREYPVKKTIKLSKDHILEISRQFDDKAKDSGDSIIMSLPGISRVEIRISGKGIAVETSEYQNDADKTRSISLYNALIEKLTGYSAKERRKFLSK